jgi:hypothetical protein
MDKLYLTSAGQALVAELIAGTNTASFKQVVSSNHEYALADIQSLTTIADVKQTVDVSQAVEADASTVTVTAAFTNASLEAGYYIKTVGLYAQDGNGALILFGVAIDNDHPDYLYPYGGHTVSGVQYDIDVAVGAAAQIDLTVDPAALVTVTTFNAHKDATVKDSNGVHGFRVVDGKPQYKDGSWKDIATGGSKITITTEDEDLFGQTVTISDGTTTLTGQFSAEGVVTFDGVMLIGTLTVSSTAEGDTVTDTISVPYYGIYNVSFGRSLYTINISTTETTLFNKAVTITNGIKTKTSTIGALGTATVKIAFTGSVTVSATDGDQTATSEIVVASGTTTYAVALSFIKTFSVIIDHAQSDPTNMVTYADDAVGMTKGSSSWWDEPIFKDIKPCVLADGGTVSYYLDPDDFSKKADGTSASITTVGNDVMIEIPRCGIKAEWLDSDKLKISLTEAENAAGYDYGAFSYAAENDCDKIYMGAYLGYFTNSKLYSVSGQTPTGNKKIGEFRTAATGRGTGYVQAQDAQWELLETLYLIFFGSLDSQTTVGRGYVDGNSAATACGGSNAYGMNSEIIKQSQPTYMTDGKHQVKCLGIEDFWGNLRWWVDGMFYNASRDILRAEYATQCNDAATGYETIVEAATAADGGDYMSKPQGVTKAMFCLKEKTGSDSTYYTDVAGLNASYVPSVGGYYSDASNAGAFYRYATAVSYANATLGARLCYMKVASA